MNLLGLLGTIALIFILYFGIFPRILLTFIRRLLMFRIYDKPSFSLILRSYFFLIPFSLFIFHTFFGLKKQTIIESLKISETGYLFMIIIVSFLFIWTIRLAVVMDKTNFLRKVKFFEYFPSVEHKLEQQKDYYDWGNQREQMRSFLFSSLLLGVLTSLMIYTFNNIVGFDLMTTFGDFKGKIGSEWIKIIFSFFLSGFVIYALTDFGEKLLKKYGIHKEPINKSNP